MTDQEDMFAKQMETHTNKRDKSMMQSGDGFVQVHEKERKAICKTIPWYILLNGTCWGLFVYTSYKDQLLKELKADVKDYQEDVRFINVTFFLLLTIWSQCLLVARIMLAVKIPNAEGPRKCLIKFFVTLRVLILCALAFDIGLFYLLAYKVIQYTFDHEDKSLSTLDSYDCYCIIGVQVFLAIFVLIHLWILIVWPIQNCWSAREYRGCCTTFSYHITKKMGQVMQATCEFLYPAARFEQETEYSEAKSMKEMREDSVKFTRSEIIMKYMNANSSTLSTFKELTCPKCEVDLEDGDEVTVSQCNLNCTYHKACIEEILWAGDDDCVKCEEPIIKALDGGMVENAFGTQSTMIN